MDAGFYCVDCTQLQCEKCTERVHFPGTKTEFHSIEEITPVESRGVHVITPIIDEILLCIIATVLWRRINVGPDYLHTQLCPVVGHVRQWTSYIDTGLYIQMKGTLAECCDNEDSFWKFFFDLWVRSTVTSSDNWFLLLSELPYAFFGIGILIMLSPLVAVVYATFTALLHAVEMRLPPHPTLRTMERTVAVINKYTTYPADAMNYFCNKARIDLIAELADGDMPPTTCPRARPAMDSVDRFTYAASRALRYFWYFYESTVAGITKGLLTIVLNTLILRFFAIWLGLGPVYLSVVKVVGWPFGIDSLIEQHQEWFSVTGTEAVNGILVAIWNRSPLAAYNVPAILLGLLVMLRLAARWVSRYLDAEREAFREKCASDRRDRSVTPVPRTGS